MDSMLTWISRFPNILHLLCICSSQSHMQKGHQKHNVTVSNTWRRICNFISPLKTNIISPEDSPRDDIVIINADKGDAVVIMDVNDYIREAKPQLNEPRDYEVLAKDPTTTNNDLINQTIDRFTKEQLINDNIANGLKNHHLEPPSFTYLQKFTKKGT